MVDPILYAEDRLKPRSDTWRKGPKITKSDIMNGTGEIQKISHAEAFLKAINKWDNSK